MADYYTQFSCIFDVGSIENAGLAENLRKVLADGLERDEGGDLGFDMKPDHETGPGALWIHSHENGKPEHVIQFVIKCAEAFSMTGLWGFRWALTCSRPRLDGFGGGAQMIDLARRETVAWVDCEQWVADQLAAAEYENAGVANKPRAEKSARRSRTTPTHDEAPSTDRTFLDALSGHLSPNTWTWLDTQFADVVLRAPTAGWAAQLAGGKTRHGWLVYAPEDAADDVPKDLAAVLTAARAQDAMYVLFDCDGLPVPGLPVLHPDFLA